MRYLRDELGPPSAIQLEPDLYRLRIGDYRIIYAIFEDVLVVFVCKVARRSEATYKGPGRACRPGAKEIPPR